MVFQTELREKRCYTVIDLSALKENLITAKKLLSPEMKVIGVVKANSLLVLVLLDLLMFLILMIIRCIVSFI